MSHHRGDARNARDPRNVGDPRRDPRPPNPIPGRVKHRKTKRERDLAKFGRNILCAGWRGAGPPPRKLPLPWGARPPGSPLPAPKAVVITQKRLCQHRGLFDREVKSVDVQRLLSPAPAQDEAPRGEAPILQLEGDPRPVERPPQSPPEAPRRLEEKEGLSQPPLRDVAARLRSVLGRVPAFPGRDLVGERRGTLLAALLRRHRLPPDLSFLLAHRNRGPDAAPQGRWSPQTPELERGDFGENKQSWDTTPPYRGTPGPLQAIAEGTPAYTPRLDTPSPIFRGDGKEQETPFSWTSAEEDLVCPDSPAPLFRPREARTPDWGGPHWHGGALPGSPLARVPPGCACGGPPFAPSAPRPPLAALGEAAGEGRGWSRRAPITLPAFGPAAPRRHGLTRRPGPAPLAPRCPEPRPGGSPAPGAPDAWSPTAPQPAGFVPGWPCAERRAPRCHHRHPLRHDPTQPRVFRNDPVQPSVFQNDPIQLDVLRNARLRHDPLRSDPIQHDPRWHDPAWHDVLRNDPPRHGVRRHDSVQPSVFQNDLIRHDELWNDPLRHNVLRNDPPRHGVRRHDSVQPSVFQNDPIRHDELRNDPLRHDVLQNELIRHDELWNDPLWHNVLHNDPIRHDELRNDPPRHRVLRRDLLEHDTLRNDRIQPSVLWNDPLRHDRLRHSSQHLVQPPPAEHGSHAESHRRCEWEERREAPEPRGRWGLGEPGWVRAPHRPPFSCIPLPEAPEWDRSPLPVPESWGCPCAGLC